MIFFEKNIEQYSEELLKKTLHAFMMKPLRLSCKNPCRNSYKILKTFLLKIKTGRVRKVCKKITEKKTNENF